MSSPVDITEGRRRSLDEALLRRRSRRAAGDRPDRTIPRATRGAPLPLSSGQRRFLLVNEFDLADDSASGAGNFAFWLRLRGELDQRALHRALEELCRRHDVLRTVYPTEGGVPVQLVRDHTPGTPGAPAARDFSSEPDPAAAARAAATTMAAEAFRLDEEAPIRWDLFRLGERDHVLLLRIHHIAADGWSEGVLNRELSSLYRAFLGDLPAPLPPLPIQYADYAAWQQGQLASGALEADLGYWQRTLAGPPAVTELPFDRAPAEGTGTAGAVLRLPVDRATSDRIAALSAAHGASLFHTLLAGYAALLTRCSGRTDVVVGAPVANRNAETADLIGFFVNTIALRVDTSGNPCFAELLGRVKDVALEAADHQEAPFEQVVERVAPPRVPGRQPLVQTMLQVHNTPGTALALDGLEVEQEQLFTASTAADLSASFVEHQGELIALWEYRTELFDAGTVRRIHEDLLRLIEAAVAQPTLGIAELDLLGPEEHDTLRAWSAGPRRAEPAGVLDLLEAQVRRTPDRPAVRCGTEQITYAELDRRANALAHRLRELGVGRDTLVGLCLGRGIDMVVSVLAVLKAGAAYLPLDPVYPSGRLRLMVEDAAPALILTHARTADRLSGVPVPELRLDQERESLAAGPAHAPEGRPAPADLAYVIYTSGSTGRPKGVEVPHSGLANYLAWAADLYRSSRGGGSVLHSSLSFDLTVTSLFLPLLSGRPLLVIADEQPLPRLAALLTDSRQELDMTKLTPAHLRALRGEVAAAESADAVDAFVVGGEALPADLVAEWRRLAPRARFFNEYGPTEAVVGCCVHEATGDEAPDAAVPIGVPVDNTELYVLDGAGNQVRPGCVGELYIGGAQVVRGYLNRPALTAERFVPDPFGTEPGSRLYRTGDLVRYLPDGALELIGRVDDQVKIRGQRVETGEVEFSLRRCPGVADAVVVAAGTPGAIALVGYYVAENDEAPTPEELREQLADSLPRHMVPSALVRLGVMPLTENGKVDRAALPAPELAAQPEPRDRTAPAGPVEERLAQIWARTLGVDRVGVLDDFFDLGGHSLLASSVVEGIRRAWPGLPARGLLRLVFLHPTVRALAAALGEHGALGELGALGEAARPAATPARLSRPGPLPLSPAQEGLLVQVELSGSAHEYLVPLALRLSGPLDERALRQALGRICDRHEVLRCRFPRDEADHCFALPPGGQPVLTVRDLNGLEPQERPGALAALLRDEATAPLDLSAGPLLRALLVREGPEEHVLGLTTHHLVFDGASQGILLTELGAAYAAALAGEQPSTPELPSQYADLVAELAERAEHPATEDLDFWREALAGVPRLELPTDRPRAAARTGEGAALEFGVAPEVVAGLRRLAGEGSATLFMTLLAAWQCVLSAHSGQLDFAVGTSVAGRDVPGAEGVVGMFVNQLALRADLTDPGGALDFRGLLGRVKERCVKAFAHQGVPFDRVVREVRPERVAGAQPLFQVAIELADAPWSDEPVAGLRVRELPVPVTVSKFDLTVAFRPDGDRLIGEMEYDVTLFDDRRVRGLADDLVEVLHTVSAAPETPLSRLLPSETAAQTAPETAAQTASETASETASDAERLVTEAFQAVLPGVGFGPDDDFFGLGGHSVLALRVVSRLRKALGLDLPLDLMFRHPTVRELAEQIETLLLAEIEALSEQEAAATLQAGQPTSA